MKAITTKTRQARFLGGPLDGKGLIPCVGGGPLGETYVKQSSLDLYVQHCGTGPWHHYVLSTFSPALPDGPFAYTYKGIAE